MSPLVVTLHDLVHYPRPGHAEALAVEDFLDRPEVASLRWPREVVTDFLYDHGAKPEFLAAYGELDLSSLEWALVEVSATELASAPTDPDGTDWLDEVARHHQHYTSLRSSAERRAWEESGTWLRAPIVLRAEVLPRERGGLQLVEGRTRVGILKGRLRSGMPIADRHEVWMGTAR